MWKLLCAVFVQWFAVTGSVAAADLSELERRWLEGLWPVVAHARATGTPLDVVVQPQDTPGLTPLGMAFVGGRCKLVLSMRGNAKAHTLLERIAPARLGVTLELMAAHELGHCHRYLQSAFDVLPAGFSPAPLPPTLAPDRREAYLAMQATRREEAYGDLVGLAWTLRHHPQHYPALHAWLLTERSLPVIEGSDHDTRVWLRLAADGGALTGASIFDAAAAIWLLGLAAGD